MLTKEQIIKTTRLHGCELSMIDMAIIWGTEGEIQYLEDFRKEEEIRDRNVRFAAFGVFPELPERSAEDFAYLKEYAELARDEIKSRVEKWATENGLTASWNKFSGGVQFFDALAMAKLEAGEEPEEPEE